MPALAGGQAWRQETGREAAAASRAGESGPLSPPEPTVGAFGSALAREALAGGPCLVPPPPVVSSGSGQAGREARRTCTQCGVGAIPPDRLSLELGGSGSGIIGLAPDPAE